MMARSPRKSFVFAAMLAAFSCTAVLADSTTAIAPTDPAWVQQLGQSIIDGSLNADGVKVEQFGSSVSQAATVIEDAVSGRSALVTLVYRGVPLTLASDIANGLKDQAVSDATKRMFTPRTAADQSHADAIASRWVQNILKPAATETVGIIVFAATDSEPTDHGADHPADRLAAKPAGPVIVLIAADTSGAEPHIRRMIFGDPRQQ